MATILKRNNVMFKSLTLFVSWLKVLIGFYVLGMFKSWTWEQLDFFEKHYKPQNRRDERLKSKILEYNKRKLWQQS